MKKLSLFAIVFLLALFTAGSAWSDDHGNSCDTATPVNLDGSGRATIFVDVENTDDVDFIKINAPARGSLNVWYGVDDVVEWWEGNIDFDILNSSCSSIKHGSRNRFGIVISAQVNAGINYLVFKGIDHPEYFEGKVFFEKDDHGDSFETAPQISLNSEVSVRSMALQMAYRLGLFQDNCT